MPDFKLVINDPKTAKSYQKIVTGNEADVFRGLKIKSKVNGEQIGLKDYQLEITGGSDNAGFPMRFDIEGILRRRPLINKGPGVKGLKKGEKIRKTVSGNTISHITSQINLKVLKHGSKSLDEIFGKVQDKKEESAPQEAKKESS